MAPARREAEPVLARTRRRRPPCRAAGGDDVTVDAGMVCQRLRAAVAQDLAQYFPADSADLGCRGFARVVLVQVGCLQGSQCRHGIRHGQAGVTPGAD